MELQNLDSRQHQQQVALGSFFSLLDENACENAGLPRLGDEMTVADFAAVASPPPGCEAPNDGYDPTSSSGALGVLFDTFPRCRSNTWHGRARNVGGRLPMSHHLSQHQQQAVFAIGGASADDTEEDDVNDDEMERASRSTPSSSDPGDFTLNLGAGLGFGSGTALGSSGCGSSSSSSIAGGYDNASDLGAAGGAAFSSVSPGTASTAVGSSASRKSTSRRNAWGNLSYADLITRAIESSPDQRLTLSQIYAWMVANVPFFRDKGENNSSAGWKNSIRHNLSLHSRFMRLQNEGTGKSSWWIMNPDATRAVKAPRRLRALTLDTKSFERQRRCAAAIADSAGALSSGRDACRKVGGAVGGALPQHHATSGPGVGRRGPDASDDVQHYHQQRQQQFPEGRADSTFHDVTFSSVDVRRGRASSLGAVGLGGEEPSSIETIHEADVGMMSSLDECQFLNVDSSSLVTSSMAAPSNMFAADDGPETLSETLADIFAGDLSMSDSDGAGPASSSCRRQCVIARSIDGSCPSLSGLVTMSYGSSMAFASSSSSPSSSTTTDTTHEVQYFRSPSAMPKCPSYGAHISSLQKPSCLSTMSTMFSDVVDVKPQLTSPVYENTTAPCYRNVVSNINYLQMATNNGNAQMLVAKGIDQHHRTSPATQVPDGLLGVIEYGSGDGGPRNDVEMPDVKPSMTSCMYDAVESSTMDTTTTTPRPSEPPYACGMAYMATQKYQRHNNMATNSGYPFLATAADQVDLVWSKPTDIASTPYFRCVQQRKQCQQMTRTPTPPPLHHMRNAGPPSLATADPASGGRVSQVVLARLLAERPHLMEKMQQLIHMKRRQLVVQLQQHRQQTQLLQRLTIAPQPHQQQQQLQTVNYDRIVVQPISTAGPGCGFQMSSSSALPSTSRAYSTALNDAEFGLMTSSSSSPTPPSTFFPADLDLNFVEYSAPDMDCDIDQVIEHELALDGKLDFMFDCFGSALVATTTGNTAYSAAIGGN